MKKPELYDSNGYVNIKGILETGCPFIFIWGGRGTGKTYGILKHAVENNKKFIYLRTRQTQIDMIRTPQFNPFKQYNTDCNRRITPSPINKMYSGFYDTSFDEKTKKYTNAGEPLGYSAALGTISNLRGFGAADVELMFYDEFIPEKTEPQLKNATIALLNGYETINRNRELMGDKPLQLVCASNSENANCDIFAKLGLIRKVTDMHKSGQEFSYLPDRGIILINLANSPISQAKSETAVYRMVGKDSDFYKMSIQNDFYAEDYSDIKSEPVNEYVPLVTVGEITVYTHKSKEKLYITQHLQGSPQITYSTSTRDLTAFRHKFIWVWGMYLDGLVSFSDIESKYLLDNYFKM